MVNQMKAQIIEFGDREPYRAFATQLVGMRGTLFDYRYTAGGWYDGFFRFDREVFLRPDPTKGIGIKYAFFASVRLKRLT